MLKLISKFFKGDKHEVSSERSITTKNNKRHSPQPLKRVPQQNKKVKKITTSSSTSNFTTSTSTSSNINSQRFDRELRTPDLPTVRTPPNRNYRRRVSEVAKLSKENDVCLEDFTLIKVIGKGSFGKVYQVRKKDTKDIYAMKVLSKQRVMDRNQYNHTLSERHILENTSHPFLVSLRFAFQSGSKLYMVFDFFNGGELYHYLSRGPFKLERAKFYAAEIALGIGYLHDSDIIYRDLKPENILLDSEGHIKITDFGLSKEGVKGDDCVKSICGTPEYLAPEVLRKKPYTKAVDWWSFGTLVYEMIAGLPPFYDKNRQKMYRKILRLELRKSKGMDSITFDFLSRLLERNPAKRLGSKGGSEEVRSHPFFRGFDWEKVFNKQIQPPFTPKVSDGEDVSNIDKNFLRETAIVTPTPADAVLVDQDAFGGFTFLGVSVLDDIIYEMGEGVPDAMECEVEEIYESSQIKSIATTTTATTPTTATTTTSSITTPINYNNNPLDSPASSVVEEVSNSPTSMMHAFAEIASSEARLPVPKKENDSPSNMNETNTAM